MVKSKDKGQRWERDAVDLLNERWDGTWKKIPGSGAFGAILEIDDLRGDLVGNYFFLSTKIRGEAKTGYGGATQLTVKREWFEKIRKEAKQGMIPEIPMLICKFSGSRSDMRYFVAFDFDAFHELLEEMEKLYNENVELRDKLQGF